MQKRYRSGFSALVLSVAVLIAKGDATTEPARPTTAAVLKAFSEALPQAHFSRQAMDDRVSQRAWDLFFAELDRNRLYFLAADIERFKARRETLDDELARGDISFAKEVVDVLKHHISNRVDYVKSMMNAPIDFTVKDTYRWDRKEAVWPKDEAERDALWQQQIKSELLAHRFRVERAEAEKEAQLEREGEGEDVQDPAADADATEAEPDEEVDEDPPGRSQIIKRYERVRDTLSESGDDWVLERFLSSFCRAYDPHCGYMPPAKAENFNIAMSLSLVGIGAVLTSDGGLVKIVRIIPGGPADRDTREERLQAGDKIIAVSQDTEDAVDVRHMPLNDVVQLIRGEKGTRVVLTVIPVEDPAGIKTRELDLIRDEIRLEEQAAKHEVRAVGEADRKVGVIRLPSFYGDIASEPGEALEGSAHDVAKILESFRTNDVQGVLIDLRGNGGGSLREVAQMTGLFIPRGPVVFVQSPGGYSSIPDNDPSVLYGGPMVLLVDRRTASASEILAGALQDYERAVIVGDSKTFGKGTVQTVFPLAADPAYGSLKVTTAVYYRVLGGSTQLKGVRPDVVISSFYDCLDIGEEYQDYALEWRMFRPRPVPRFGNLAGVVAELEARSESRRGADSRFAAYTNLLERACDVYTVKTVPLDYDGYRQRMEERREIEDLQKAFTAADPEKDSNDLVLTEGLAVLDDMMGLFHGNAWPVAPGKAEGGGPEPSPGLAAMARLVEALQDADEFVRLDAVRRIRGLRQQEITVFMEYILSLPADTQEQIRHTLKAAHE